MPPFCPQLAPTDFGLQVPVHTIFRSASGLLAKSVEFTRRSPRKDLAKELFDEPGEKIGALFGASHVLTDLKHEAFLKKAEADPFLTELYRDDYAVILKVGE